jgi:hypoxanthine-DNA glycosylase
VLVLGTLPGERSLAAGQYYAHPQNRFWHLVGHAIGRDLASLAYPERLDLLRAVGIGLWDTIASATRQGSLDAAIREAEAAPLAALVAKLPALRAVAFNGVTAARIGTPQLDGSGLALLPLPSSSPANASIPLARKQQAWAQIGEFLG